MERFLGRYSPYIYSLLRIVTGFLFVWHGSQKLFGFPVADKPSPLNGMMAIAGTIEFVCGLLVMIGLFTGFAAFLASGLMAVAYFMVHAPGGFLPLQNRGELAVIYCFVLLYIASRGSGALSVDSLIWKNNQTANVGESV